MTIMDLREKAGCWAGCDGCAKCTPVVSADPECWTPAVVDSFAKAAAEDRAGLTVPFTDATLADLGVPAPEEAGGGPDCGS